METTIRLFVGGVADHDALGDLSSRIGKLISSSHELAGANVAAVHAEAMRDAKSNVPRGFGYVDLRFTPPASMAADAVKTALFKALKPLQGVTFRGAKVRVEGARPSALERNRVEKATAAAAAIAARAPAPAVASKPVRLRRRKGEPALLLPLTAVDVDEAAARGAEGALLQLSRTRMSHAARNAAEKAAREVLHRGDRPVRIVLADAGDGVVGVARWDSLEGDNGTHESRRVRLQAAAESPVHMPVSSMIDSDDDDDNGDDDDAEEGAVMGTSPADATAEMMRHSPADDGDEGACISEDHGADAEEDSDKQKPAPAVAVPRDAAQANGEQQSKSPHAPASLNEVNDDDTDDARSNVDLDDEDDDDMVLANVVSSSLPSSVVAAPSRVNAAAATLREAPANMVSDTVEMDDDMAAEADKTLRVLADMFKDPSMTQVRNLKRRRASSSGADAPSSTNTRESAAASAPAAPPRINAWRALLYGEQAAAAGAQQSTVLPPPTAEVAAPPQRGGVKRPRYMLQTYTGAIVPHRDNAFKFGATFDERVVAAAASPAAEGGSQPRPATFAFNFDLTSSNNASSALTAHTQVEQQAARTTAGAANGVPRAGARPPAIRSGAVPHAAPRPSIPRPSIPRPAAPDMKSIAMSFMRPVAGAEGDLPAGMHVAEDGSLRMSQVARNRLKTDYKKHLSRVQSKDAGSGRGRGGGRGGFRGRSRR